MLFLEHYGLSDAGKVRQNNEDSLLVGEGRDTSLFVVADGIGGFEAGEVASSIAVETLRDLGPGDSFDDTIQEANHRILSAARDDDKLSGMGTTVVAIRFAGTDDHPAAEVAHVGDSRAYLLRNGELKPLTEDHSLVAELVRSGDLTRAQAAEHPQKNLITRALGAEDSVEVDTTRLPVEQGDRILLCSDGLTDMVPEDRISEILSEPSQDPEAPSRQLLSEALEAGGTDNITLVLVDVKKQERSRAERRRERSSRSSRNLLDEASSGTQEMQAIDPNALTESSTSTTSDEPRSRRRDRTRSSFRRRSMRARNKRRRGRLYPRIIMGFVRLAAVIIVIVLLITPFYLWGSSRYYLDFESSEVVAYRGLPYEVLGVPLNEEWDRSGIERSEVKTPYQQRIEENQLLDQGEVEEILQDLRN
ncbi:MAG: Stp1/IreP family PP2C-type Ser/Thr phosphatase [Rubrobacteraceae bacterium]